jgi:hypothetical protein
VARVGELGEPTKDPDERLVPDLPRDFETIFNRLIEEKPKLQWCSGY